MPNRCESKIITFASHLKSVGLLFSSIMSMLINCFLWSLGLLYPMMHNNLAFEIIERVDMIVLMRLFLSFFEGGK